MGDVIVKQTGRPTFENPENTRSHELKKLLGVVFGIAVLVGGTIGSGILRNPGTIAQLLDNYWLIIGCWLFGGLYVLMGVGSFSELATMFPKAGGAYNYVKEAYGNYPAFLTGWFDFISNGITPAYFCILIGEYFILLFPGLGGHEKTIAIAFLLCFTMLHLTGVKTASIVQQITSALKVIIFAALIIACFVLVDGPTGTGTNNTANNVITGTILIAILQSLQLVFGTYSGWNSTCFFAEEDKNPTKNIPRSLYSGAIIVILIYVLINMAFLHVLPVAALANSTLVASDVAEVLFGKTGATLITIVALFSIVSILNAYMMIPARILFGMSRDKFFVSRGTYVNSKGTPTFSLIFSALLNLVLIIIGSFNTLFALSAFMSVTVFLFVYASLVKLRKSRPDLPRPYKAWGHPVTTFILIILSAGLLIGFAFGDPPNLIVMLVVTALSFPVYRLLVKKNKA